ncbi:nucleic acid-binding protein [Extibacter muris]|nr:nucleic acid-binding protein [Extibacter muris]MCU0078865.1 nucleic acid-binding protein [Extibacter muris]
MVEGLDIKVEGGAYGIKVTQQGVFKDNLGKFKCAVCPECGYTETYIENPERVKKLIVDKK